MAEEHGQLLAAIRTKRPDPPWLDMVKRATFTAPTRQSPTSKLSGTATHALLISLFQVVMGINYSKSSLTTITFLITL